VNDAERLRHDPAMRWIVGGKAAQRRRGFAESDVHGRRPPRGTVLDMDLKREPDPRRAGDERLERPLRACPVPAACRVGVLSRRDNTSFASREKSQDSGTSARVT